MLNLKKKSLSCGLFLLLTMTGCAQYQGADSPSERSQATHLAQRFLTALDQGNSKEVIKISSLPFWGDRDYLIDQNEFESIVREETAHPHNKIKKYKSSHVTPFADFEAIAPRTYAKIKRKMDSTGLYVVFLAVESQRSIKNSPNTRVENVIILVRKDKNNHWTVVGIED